AASVNGLAERSPPASEIIPCRLARRGKLKALESDEDEGKPDAQGDHGEDHGAEHGLQLGAARACDRERLGQAGHTLILSGGKPSCRRSPSRHSRPRGMNSATWYSPPRATRAS